MVYVTSNGAGSAGWTHPLWHDSWDATLTKIAEDRRMNSVPTLTREEAEALAALASSK